MTSAYGAKAVATGQQSALNYQANISDLNAQLAESNAQQELLRGQRRVAALTLKAGHLKSSQRASLAANGVDLGVGSPAEVLASTDLMKESDVSTITANAIRSAWGYRLQGANYKGAAIMQRAGASGISPSGAFNSTLLTGANGVAENWYKLAKSGVFDFSSSGSGGGLGSGLSATGGNVGLQGSIPMPNYSWS